jgi:hypothetical protein
VTVTAQKLGPVAELAERRGLTVARRLSELPADCDAIVVQDAIGTAPIVALYPDARVVHVAHSDLFDQQLPVLVPGVVDAVVVLSDRVAARVRALALDVPVVRLRQPIDTRRFTGGARLPPRPRRALLLGNYLDGDRRAALVDAWRAAGVECLQVGAPTHAALDVLPEIAAADIVVAKGRAALEAMSCGRAVYVFDMFGGDGWVTAENYPALEADGFAGHATPTPRGVEDLAADVARYRPSMGWVNHELVRAHHGARRHAAQLVELLRGPRVGGERNLTALDEVSRWTRLFMHAEGRAMALWQDLAATRAHQLQSEAERERWRREAEAWTARALEAERQLQRTQSLLATRRARAGLAVGRAMDRLRRQR